MYQQGRWMRLIVTQITQFIQRTPFDKSADLPVLMMIDEFFQIGPMPSIENTLTYAPGFGLRLWLIVQDIVQLKRNYPDSWETIMGACGIKQFFGVNDLTTAKYVSEMLGEQEIAVPSINVTKTTSQTLGGNSSDTFGSSFSATSGSSPSSNFGFSSSYASGESWSETAGISRGYTVGKQARRVLKPEEVMTSFTKNNLAQIVHVRDYGGMFLIRTPFFSDPYFVKSLPKPLK